MKSCRSCGRRCKDRHIFQGYCSRCFNTNPGSIFRPLYRNPDQQLAIKLKPVTHCSNCQTEVGPNWKACAECGTLIRRQTEAPIFVRQYRHISTASPLYIARQSYFKHEPPTDIAYAKSVEGALRAIQQDIDQSTWDLRFDDDGAIINYWIDVKDLVD